MSKEQSNIYNGKSQHIRHRHNTIKYLLLNEIISIEYIRSKENIMDPLTKSIEKEQVY